MSTIIRIDEAAWSQKGSALDNRNNFNRFISKFMKPCNKNGENVNIYLPPSVNTQERHCLHKMTLKNEFSPFTYEDNQDNRIMKISLSPEYVREFFSVDSNPNQDPNQILFNNLINFIEVNLNNEFQDFLKKIK